MQIFKKLLYFLTPLEKKHASLILIMIIIMAFIDMLGVASILPFMAVLTNPSLIETNSFLSSIFQAASAIGIKTTQEFIFLLGILVFIFLIFSLSFKAFTVYVQTRFIQMRQHSISKRLLVNYIYQPYSATLALEPTCFALQPPCGINTSSKTHLQSTKWHRGSKWPTLY